MALSNWLPPTFRPSAKPNRKARRAARLRAEPLEDRVTPAYTMTLAGTTATVIADDTGNTLVVTAAGGLLLHNRFDAGDPGFESAADWDSQTEGEQTLAAAVGSTVDITQGAGDDSLVLGQGASPASGLFARFNLNDSGGGTDTVRIDDSANTTANTIVYNEGGTETGTITGDGIDFATTALTNGGYTLTSGQADDTVNVLSTYGDEEGNNSPVTITSAGGNDTVVVGNEGLTDAILAPVNVINPAGLTALTVDSSGAEGPQAVTVTGSSLTGASPATITYSNAGVGSLTVLLGSGGNTVDVLSTLGGFAVDRTTTIDTGAGDDVVTVADVRSGATTLDIEGQDGADKVTITSLGSIQNIAGAVRVGNANALTDVVIDASASALSADYNLSMTGAGDLLVSGLVGVGGSVTLTDAQIGSLTINGGTGGNAFDVGFSVPGAANTFNGGGGTETFAIAGAALGPQSVNRFNGGGGADTFTLTSGATAAQVLIDGGSETDTVAGPNTATTWQITGANAGTVATPLNKFAGVENLTGGSGTDTFTFAAGAGVAGVVDGGAGTNALNYSALTTLVAANLGLGTTGLSATLDGRQENPPTASPASGTATVSNYNPVAHTFDISVTVSNLDPTTVTGFHIHRGPVGVNGPIVIDLAAMFGLGSLVPSGTGFTFTATGVPLAAGDEAAFLGSLTYINFHTAQFPGGAVRGQLFSNGNVQLATGTATSTGGVTNVQNVTGGSGNDSLVGSFAANVLAGGTGNDTVLGAPGNDTLTGGANDDVLIWSNGDNTDVMDGGTGTDLVVVNGATAKDDVFTVGAGAGGRLAFARTNLVPFALDIGTAEGLTVNGVGGNDTFTVGDLSTVTGVTDVKLNGFAGNDMFNVRPDTNVTVSVVGGDPSAAPGDVLNFDAGGQPVTLTPAGLSMAGVKTVPFREVETVGLVNAPVVIVPGTPGDDSVTLAPTGPTSADLTVNGATYSLTGLAAFRFNGGDGNDTFTLDLTKGTLTGPVTFNGGAQGEGGEGDTLVTFGGTFAAGVVTPTGPGAGTIQYTAAGLVTFSGLEPVTDLNTVTDYTIFGTAAAEAINVADGPVVMATQTGQVSSGSGTFELVNFANKTNVRVDALDGADTMTVTPFTVAIPGLATLTLAGGAADDTFTLNGFQTTGVTTTVDGGGDAGDSLTIDDAATAADGVYGVSQTQVTRDGGAGAINYTDLGTTGTVLTLRTGSGTNVINVTGTSVVTEVDGGTGVDTFNVSSDAPPNAGDLNGLDAQLVLDSGNANGSDVLTVSEAGLATPDAVLVDDGTGGAGLTGTAGGGWTVSFASANNFGGGVNLRLGSGGNTVTVASTFAGEPVNLFTGGGDDSVAVLSTDSPVLIDGQGGADAVTVGNTGLTGQINGPVTVRNSGGLTDLTVDDSADAAATVVSVFGDGAGNIVVAGIAPATITADENSLSGLTVSTGAGDDSFAIDRSVPGRTSTFNGGDGNDAFFVTMASLGAGGTVVLDGQAGDDSAALNAANVAQAFTDPVLGPPAVRFADSGNTAGVSLSSIETVRLSSNTNRFQLLGDRGGATPEADAIAVTGTAANTAVATINGSIPFTLIAMDDLRVDTFALDDTFTLTPFATPVQPWQVVVTADLGDGTDRLDYTNVPGLFDDVSVAAIGAGSGRVDDRGVGSASSDQVVRFLNTETVGLTANPGDGDKVRVALPDADTVVDLQFSPDPGTPDLTLRGLFGVDVDTANYTALTVDGGAGSDTFNLDLVGPNGAAGGTLPIPVTVNGGPPNTPAIDRVVIVGNAGLPDTFTNAAGPDPKSGTATIAGTDTGQVSYTGIDELRFDGGGGAGDDVLGLTGTGGADAFTLVGVAGQPAGSGSVSGQVPFAFTGFGSGAGTQVKMSGLGGDDLFTVTQAANWGIHTVSVDGGPPTASDTLQVTGTAGADDFVYTPSTGTLAVTSGGGTTAYSTAGIERFVADGAGGANTLTVTEFLPGLVTLPDGSLGTNPRLDYRNMSAVTVNQVPAAVGDTATTAEDTPTTIAVLANDTGLADIPLTVTIVTPPTLGTVVVNADNTVTYTPNKDANGADSFVYRVSDANGEGSTATVGVTVTAVNDAPTLTLPATLTGDEDAFIPIAGLSVADVDAGTGNVTVTLTVANGVLFVPGATGTGTATVTFTGTVAAANAALAAATYQGKSNYFGPDTLTVTVNDNGNTGTGGPLTATGAVAITVVAAADAPTLTVTPPPAGTEAVAIPLAITAALTDPSEILTLTISGVTAGARFNHGIDGGTVWTFTPADLAGLTITVPDGPATLHLVITATSATGVNASTASTSAPLVVVVANTAPTGTLTNAGPTPEGTATSVAFTASSDVSLVDAAAGLRYAFDFNNDGVFDLGDGTYAGSATGNSATVPANLLADGPGTRVVRGRVVDKDGGFTDSLTTITITNAPPTGTLVNGGPVAEGSAGMVSFVGTTDPSMADITAGFRFAFDFDNDGVFEVGDGTYAGSGKAATVTVPASFLADGPGTRVVRGRVIDKDGGFFDTTTSITINNVAPTATLSNGGSVVEGQTGTVAFAAATDKSAADVAAGFHYAFDFDNDGSFEVGDGSYAGSPISPTAVVPASFLADGTGGHVVRGRIIDKDGGFTDYTTTITVANAPPIATLLNGGAVAEGGAATVTFVNPADPSPADTVAGFRYAYDFNNDGVFDLGDGTFAGSSVLPSATVPAAFLGDGPGTRVVRGRIIDKDGGFTDHTTSITVTNTPPTATLVVDGAATVRFVGAADPSAADGSAGFTYSFDVNADGVYEQVGKSSAFTLPAAPTSPVPVRGRITDKDGGFTDYTVTVSPSTGGGSGPLLLAGSYAVGTGSGGGPLVKVLNPNGSQRAAFFAYEDTFRGGVHVAVGDVTGDGVPDVIAGAGDGGGPLVKVFDGVTLAEVAAFFAYEDTFRGGVQVAVGDVDGDGKAEIITGSGNGGGPLVKVFDGRGNQRTGFFAYEDTFRGGVPVAAGDVDGDGKAEIVTGAGVGGGPLVKVFNGQTAAFIGGFLAYDSAARGGVYVAAGDLDGNGKAEIVTGPAAGSGGEVRVFAGTGFAAGGAFTPFTGTGGVDVAARDVTGDGKAEILAASGRGLPPQVSVRNGQTFAAIRTDSPFEATFLGGLFVG